MTEAEWLAATNLELHDTLKFLEDKASDRKMRLFICACCYLIWDLLGQEESRRAVIVGERFADGNATAAQIRAAGDDADALAVRIGEREPEPSAYAAPFAAGYACCEHGHAAALTWSAALMAGAAADSNGLYEANHGQIDCLRDIFGNPFHPVTFFPEWRTSTVLALAQQMYDSRDFSGMPILADALQDSGCADESILTHCRGPGPHVRGCHVIDACLSKS